MVHVKATVEMSRDLYLDVDESTPENDILLLAQQAIIYPHIAVKQMQDSLARLGIQTNLKLDLNDWEVNSTNIELVQ